jgi:hypothetical protein
MKTFLQHLNENTLGELKNQLAAAQAAHQTIQDQLANAMTATVRSSDHDQDVMNLRHRSRELANTINSLHGNINAIVARQRK